MTSLSLSLSAKKWWNERERRHDREGLEREIEKRGMLFVRERENER